MCNDVQCLGSAGEAAYMTGLERNADIVFAAAYAPVLQVWYLFTMCSSIPLPNFSLSERRQCPMGESAVMHKRLWLLLTRCLVS